uniref:SF3 helicase domain-containing protein n=1 Tax=viral metagenome TaxID=1070528 RepID=A0A6C0CYH4_9ZZZZ
MREWYSFLSKFMNDDKSRDSGSRPTHVTMLSPKNKKYLIPTTETDTMLDIYSKYYMDTPMGMLELSGSVMPVVADIDFKNEVTQSSSILVEEIFEFDFILYIATLFREVLAEIVDICPDDLCCFILQKKPYLQEKNERTYLKHGFHLHFPKIFLSKWTQEKELLPRLRLEYKKRNQYSHFSIDHFLDKGYCKGNGTPWLLYGSRKNELLEPYWITHLVSGQGLVMEEGQWERFFLDESYEIYRWDQESESPKAIELTMENLSYHLPRILSIQTHHRDNYVYEMRKEIQPLETVFQIQNSQLLNSQIQRQQTQKRLSSGVGGGHENMDDEEASFQINEEMVDDLMELLDISRSRDRNEWMYVGWVLFNIFRGRAQGFERWVQFSKRSPEMFDQRVCEYEWSKMIPKNLTLGSLKFLVKTDNPEMYSTVMERYSRIHIEKAMKLNGTHTDLALALYEKYECEYVCASIREKIWYRFQEPVWELNEEGVNLRSKISSEIVLNFEKMAMDFQQEMFRSEDKDDSGKFKKKRDACAKLIQNLKSAPYKKNIMTEAMEIFYHPKFISKLDSSPHLFAFANGVMDLKTFEFRAGRPQDFLSIHAPIKYRQDLTDFSDEIQGLRDFLQKIFPDKEVRDYFLDISSDIFMGGNRRKLFQIWSGVGNNGKSVVERLFESMLGQYAVKLPTSLIVGKRTQSSQACPELVRAGHGVRMAMIQEPGCKDIINIGILKELSGNDSFFARGLYQGGGEVNPMFKLVLICNDPPKIPGHDEATRNRIRIIPFESRFVDAEVAPEDPLEQLRQKVFPKDKDLLENIGGLYAEAFAWLLLKHYQTRPSSRPEPEKVKMATAKYMEKNDVYKQFCDEMMESPPTDTTSTTSTTTSKIFLSLNELYLVFKDWYRESIPNAAIPTKNDLKDHFTKEWGAPTRSSESKGNLGWPDYKLRDFTDNSTTFTV